MTTRVNARGPTAAHRRTLTCSILNCVPNGSWGFNRQSQPIEGQGDTGQQGGNSEFRQAHGRC